MKREAFVGPPPSIGHLRSMGLVAFTVHCRVERCGKTGRVLFDALGLPDEAIFIEIPHERSLTCTGCGTRSYEISPDWRDHVAQGNGNRG